MSRNALRTCLSTFDENKTGWSLDAVWNVLLNHPKNEIAIIDDVIAIHTRPVFGGDIYNELPDRISDTVSILGAAYACDCPQLGLWASLVALLTAYIRTLCTGAGAPADFGGPMAKQQRMKLLIAAGVISVLG